jgi:hypothetical protein
MAERKQINRSKVVEFLQPYSNKQEGDKMALDSLLAANLVRKGVAVYAFSEFAEELEETKIKKLKSKKQ